MVHIVSNYTGRATQTGLGTTLNVLKCPSRQNPEWNPIKLLCRDLKIPHTQRENSEGACRLAHCTACDQKATEVNHHHRDGNIKLYKHVKATGVTTHLLFFNNSLSIALHLLHNDLFFFWQQDLRDAFFPYRCTQIQRSFGFTSASAGEGLSEESRKAKHTCGVLVQAGARAVSLDHPQYLGIFLQGNCACGQSDFSVPVTQLQIYQLSTKTKCDEELKYLCIARRLHGDVIFRQQETCSAHNAGCSHLY